MRKSPGFEVGYWLKLPNEYPRFCATSIGESFRSCLMQSKPYEPHCAFAQNFSIETCNCFYRGVLCRYIESDLRKVMLEWAKQF